MDTQAESVKSQHPICHMFTTERDIFYDPVADPTAPQVSLSQLTIITTSLTLVFVYVQKVSENDLVLDMGDLVPQFFSMAHVSHPTAYKIQKCGTVLPFGCFDE